MRTDNDFEDPIITINADYFEPMRGHIAPGTIVIFADGSRGELVGMMAGWIMVDVATKQTIIPPTTHYAVLTRQIRLLAQQRGGK